MRKTAIASSLFALVLLALGVVGIHSVQESAGVVQSVSLALALLALPYVAFCLARPTAYRGWAIATWVLNGSVAVFMVVLAALVLMTGFALGSKLFAPCLAIVATTGINLAALHRARPATGSHTADIGEPDASLVGFRGWLLLLGAGILIAPVRIAVSVYPWCRSLFLDGAWQALGDPDHPAYNPLWRPVIVGELAANAGLFALWMFIAYLFLSRKKAFRTWFIVLSVSTPLLLSIDGALTHMVAPDDPVPDPKLLKDFFTVLVAALIWVPYVLVSKRVKATFVN